MMMMFMTMTTMNCIQLRFHFKLALAPLYKGVSVTIRQTYHAQSHADTGGMGYKGTPFSYYGRAVIVKAPARVDLPTRLVFSTNVIHAAEVLN